MPPPPGNSDAPLDMLWRPPAVLAVTAVGMALALILALAPGVVGSRLGYFGLASLFILWVGLCTLCILFALRRPLARLPPVHVAWAALGCLVLTTAVMGGLSHMLVPAIAFGSDLQPWLGQLILLAFTVGALGLAAFHSHWNNRMLALRTSRAELEALQARIRPHFLFNTLNTGAALVHEKPEAAEELLLDLADLFRAALSGPEQIDLTRELDLTLRYLHIEQLRYDARLRLRWEVPVEIPATRVPALTLQPLVENAIRHGVEGCPDGGELLVQVCIGQETVQILIQNPVSQAAPRPSPGHAIGQASVRARLAALSHGRAKLEVHPGKTLYRVTLSLPLD